MSGSSTDRYTAGASTRVSARRRTSWLASWKSIGRANDDEWLDAAYVSAVPVTHGMGQRYRPVGRYGKRGGRVCEERRARPWTSWQERGGVRLALTPPPPALQIVEHDLVAPAGGDDLPVPAAQRFLGPPPILDQPRLADRVDLAIVDLARTAVIARVHRDTAGHREAAGSAHRLVIAGEGLDARSDRYRQHRRPHPAGVRTADPGRRRDPGPIARRRRQGPHGADHGRLVGDRRGHRARTRAGPAATSCWSRAPGRSSRRWPPRSVDAGGDGPRPSLRSHRSRRHRPDGRRGARGARAGRHPDQQRRQVDPALGQPLL